MLRTMVIALALGLPSLAAAEEQFPQSAQDVEVRGDDGTVVGRVSTVARDARGNIVAVEIPGLEPGDAPYASDDLVAERNDLVVPASARERDRPYLQAGGRGEHRTLR